MFGLDLDAAFEEVQKGNVRKNWAWLITRFFFRSCRGIGGCLGEVRTSKSKLCAPLWDVLSREASVAKQRSRVMDSPSAFGRSRGGMTILVAACQGQFEQQLGP